MLMTSLYNRKYKICFMLYIKTFNNNSIKHYGIFLLLLNMRFLLPPL